MAKKIKITRKRHYKPHAEYLHAANVHIQHYEEEIGGHFYSLMSSYLLSAFAFEAYMNYIGPKVAPQWSEFKYARVPVKISHICVCLGIDMDSSKPPFQTISELFSFRNKMAHAHDEEITKVTYAHEDHYQKELYEEPRPSSFDRMSQQDAKKCLIEVRAAITLLNSKLKEPDDFPLSQDGWEGCASG